MGLFHTILNIVLWIKMTLDGIFTQRPSYLFCIMMQGSFHHSQQCIYVVAQLQSCSRDPSQIAVVLHREPHTGKWTRCKGKIEKKESKKWKWDWRTNDPIKNLDSTSFTQRKRERESRSDLGPRAGLLHIKVRMEAKKKKQQHRSRKTGEKLWENSIYMLLTYKSHQSKCKVLIWPFL